ncbi:hypothetical protein J2W83_003879 [Pseudomonas hunanensis]|uniref:Uncharacterized protein n=1 Tax=Pseudomonas hunanensis TaxID=1247546 RepID=A0ACC6K774_9PSED|nr:hypothetical protein [Pseudomonas hunanensis]MDR6714258.1 hypothetical protein [Pseudomonas hunanensis]
MSFESKISYSVILLPILLMYVLMAIRLLDRWRAGGGVSSIINVRDAALVAIALDVSGLAGVLDYGLGHDNILPIAMVMVALSFHLIFYVSMSRVSFSAEGFLSRSVTRSIMNLYIALTLLMTNAVTLLDMMQAMGKGL